MPHYEISKTYNINGITAKLNSFIQCKEDDGQESCVLCKGKKEFITINGKKIIRCGYKYNENNHNWEASFEEIK